MNFTPKKSAHFEKDIWHQNQVKVKSNFQWNSRADPKTAWWYIDVHLVEYDDEEGGDNNADNDGDNSLNNHYDVPMKTIMTNLCI